MKWFTSLGLLVLIGCTTLKESTPTLPLQHTVQPGETVDSLARRYYGEELYPEGFQAILKANPQLKNAGTRANSLVLTIPKLEDERSSEPSPPVK